MAVGLFPSNPNSKMQVIPFSLAFAGVRPVYLQMIMISLLCKLHQLVHQPSFKPCDIQEMDRIIPEYLDLVETHAPALKTKVKAHLLTHLVDEIKRHDPPVSYSEDVFEKRHKAIRAKIFQQENQLARSRDTALIFVKNIIFGHVISGGFFQKDSVWVQSSGNVQELAKSQQVRNFLGQELCKEKNLNMLVNAERASSRKSHFGDVSEFRPENVLLQALLDAGIQCPRLEGTMLSYGSIRSRDGKRLNTGDSVLFINREEEEQIEILRGGVLILLQAKRLEFAKNNSLSTLS